MAVAYYGSHISEHLVKTPEGYLICYDVPINRTGTQMYTAGELGLEGEPERPVTVYRLEEDVFSAAALASLEGKDITRGHPAEMLAAENQASYSKGHLEHVRRDGDNTVADLIIKDPGLASDVESGVLREVSCGYYCRFEPYLDGYRQTNLVGNHVAVVPRGRAGHSVAIKDHAAGKAEKGLKRMKKETKEALYRFFGLAANDAAPEELEQLTRDVSTVATALDADPAAKAPEAEPAGDAAQASDEMVERAPKGDDIGSKLDRILEMLEAKARGGRGERPLHDEEDLDDLIEKLAGEETVAKEKAVTIPAEEMADQLMEPGTRDAAVALLKKVRPAVAAIQNRAERARVVDALLSTIQGPDVMSGIVQAARDSAQKAADTARRTSYETACAEAQAAYAARNPHKAGKEGE